MCVFLLGFSCCKSLKVVRKEPTKMVDNRSQALKWKLRKAYLKFKGLKSQRQNSGSLLLVHVCPLLCRDKVSFLINDKDAIIQEFLNGEGCPGIVLRFSSCILDLLSHLVILLDLLRIFLRNSCLHRCLLKNLLFCPTTLRRFFHEVCTGAMRNW